MNTKDSLAIRKIQDEIYFIQKTVMDICEQQFMHDEILQHAITMSFITIGECANHLSDAFRDNYPDIEWVKIVAVRNIAAHGYWKLDMRQIWKAVVEDIPKLEEFFGSL